MGTVASIVYMASLIGREETRKSQIGARALWNDDANPSSNVSFVDANVPGIFGKPFRSQPSVVFSLFSLSLFLSYSLDRIRPRDASHDLRRHRIA